MNIVEKFQEIISQNGVICDVFFCQKRRSDYIAYNPGLSGDVKKELLNLIIKYLIKKKEFNIIDFDPTSRGTDSMIECCDKEFVGNFDEVLDSFNTADHVNTDIKPEDLSFYCIKIHNEHSQEIFLFRRLTQFKKLSRKGIELVFNPNNGFNKLDGDLIGMDATIDVIFYDEKLYILSHTALERIFRIDQQIVKYAQSMFERLQDTHKILNFDQFKSDCMCNKTLQKLFCKMNKETQNVTHAFDNPNKIHNTINQFNLQINMDSNNYLIYNDKSQIKDVVRILRDSYYVSSIQNKMGIDDQKQSIQ